MAARARDWRRGSPPARRRRSATSTPGRCWSRAGPARNAGRADVRAGAAGRARRPKPTTRGWRGGAGQVDAVPDAHRLARDGRELLGHRHAVAREFGGRPVPGAYVVDDEGVPAKDVTLVENGRLLTLLTGRTPQPQPPAVERPQPRRHGAGRRGAGAERRRRFRRRN